MIALNAAAAIYVAGICGTMQEGFAMARRVIADGSAWNRLEELAALTCSFE